MHEMRMGSQKHSNALEVDEFHLSRTENGAPGDRFGA